jgi:hypothetical protein
VEVSEDFENLEAKVNSNVLDKLVPPPAGVMHGQAIVESGMVACS